MLLSIKLTFTLIRKIFSYQLVNITWLVRAVPYCPYCGTKIPEEEDARFCPNCGASIPRREIGKRKMVLIGTLQDRMIVFLIVFVLCIIATVIGALARVEPPEAQNMVQEMDKIRNIAKVAGVQLIFGNNLMYTLVMFVPVVGPGFGFYVLYNTGRILAAYGAISKVNPVLTFLFLFALPFTWMEYISYTLAISESIWMTYAIIKRNLRNELTTMSIIIVICNILLLLGALIETSLMSLYP